MAKSTVKFQKIMSEYHRGELKNADGKKVIDFVDAYKMAIAANEGVSG